MKHIKIATVICALLLTFTSTAQVDEVFVDESGVMRWQASQKEVIFFGVNYTLPFAHGFRAAKYNNIDIRQAIDKDVYHFARLGFNAYRIHIWDVEIADAEGNLLHNEHLDLLDYLIAQLQQRGIYTLITAQTNFGNGYPERNINTGSFSYQDEKCHLHENPELIAVQANYLAQLVQHVNPYTHQSYMVDPYLVGFELNNEPCHKSSTEQVRQYMRTLTEAVREVGCIKPLFYNASHNYDVAQAYFDGDIQGATYQWYPIGLVAGKLQKGNFLPHVDSYPIPFSQFEGYNNKARLIYEYDPADVLSAYIHPAMVRSFRSAGFQWVTQFAYDPLDLAWANTEYQTHYLNLAYTPSKAISLMISAEVMAQVKRGEQFPSYPADTLFGNFMVSYLQDLSLLNAEEKFIYSNSTMVKPLQEHKLQQVVGVGNSQLVNYDGSGAYFLDKLANGLWRLELMPDVILTEDPFAKPSLRREVGQIYWKQRPIQINLKDLGEEFEIRAINEGNDFHTRAKKSRVENIIPGVYLLGKKKAESKQTHISRLGMSEFVAPATTCKVGKLYLKHEASAFALQEKDLDISLQVVSLAPIDSVLIYPSDVSFWNDDNQLYTMQTTDQEHYQVSIPSADLHGEYFRYYVVVFAEGKATCYPQCEAGTPLDWDFTNYVCYQTQLLALQKRIVLFDANTQVNDFNIYTIPEWQSYRKEIKQDKPGMSAYLEVEFVLSEISGEHVLRQTVDEQLAAQQENLMHTQGIVLSLKSYPNDLQVSVISAAGITYSVFLQDCKQNSDGEFHISWSDFQQSKTRLLPIAYPSFMNHYFESTAQVPFQKKQIAQIELSYKGSEKLQVRAVWCE